MFKALTIILLAAAVGSVPARAQGYCSNAVLMGTYAFTITGSTLTGSAAGGVSGVAMTNFDGQGNLTQLDHMVQNGVTPVLPWRAGSGVYLVNADCTGSAQITFMDGSPALTLFFVLTNHGAEMRSVVSNTGAVITSIGIKRD